MELFLKDQLFVICGASSGFGRAVAQALLEDGAKIIAVARREQKLMDLKQQFPEQVELLSADITEESTAKQIVEMLDGRPLHGVLVNAGGPPAMTVLESKISDWDNAYRSVLRWKIYLLQQLIPSMISAKYGRVLFIESASVKQPIENLVLSNAFRLGAIGFMKTFSQEIAIHGITLNALAPGSHDTNAIERLIKKRSEQKQISAEQAKAEMVKETGVGALGAADDFASLAAWLLSSHSRYVTGQTITVAGATVKGVMG